MNIQRLTVRLNLKESQYEVGELAKDDKNIHFKYYPDFINTRLKISPFKLPLDFNVHTAQQIPFDGLFGIFHDSLPDGWGKLLLDKHLTSKRIDIHQLGPLDRLAYVGEAGMGALSYHPATTNDSNHSSPLQLDLLADEVKTIIEGNTSDLIEELYTLGGSSGGAKPKIHVGYNQKKDHLIHGSKQLPEDYEHWIVKFPSSFDRPDIGNIEYAYYLMAQKAGIEMASSRLLRGTSGKSYFATKRFDMDRNNRIHMHSAAGIMHDDFQHSQMDYGNLMDCAFQLENHVEAYRKVLRLAAFNVFSHNRDDHSKNFSFLMNSSGKWQFSPAYDLTFSSSSHGLHSTMVAGESQSPGTSHLLELAKVFSVKNGLHIIEDVRESISNWTQFANDAGVTAESTKLIKRALSIL